MELITELNKKTMTKKQELIDYVIGNEFIAKPSLQEKFTDLLNEAITEQLRLHVVGSSLPDLQECNQASLDYATKKDNPDFFLIKQTFKEGINWALNYITKPK